jgi:hypothetical protein
MPVRQRSVTKAGQSSAYTLHDLATDRREPELRNPRQIYDPEGQLVANPVTVLLLMFCVFVCVFVPLFLVLTAERSLQLVCCKGNNVFIS